MANIIQLQNVWPIVEQIEKAYTTHRKEITELLSCESLLSDGSFSIDEMIELGKMMHVAENEYLIFQHHNPGQIALRIRILSNEVIWKELVRIEHIGLRSVIGIENPLEQYAHVEKMFPLETARLIEFFITANEAMMNFLRLYHGGKIVNLPTDYDAVLYQDLTPGTLAMRVSNDNLRLTMDEFLIVKHEAYSA